MNEVTPGKGKGHADRRRAEPRAQHGGRVHSEGHVLDVSADTVTAVGARAPRPRIHQANPADAAQSALGRALIGVADSNGGGPSRSLAARDGEPLRKRQPRTCTPNPVDPGGVRRVPTEVRAKAASIGWQDWESVREAAMTRGTHTSLLRPGRNEAGRIRVGTCRSPKPACAD